jgi:hypothetical protein
MWSEELIINAAAKVSLHGSMAVHKHTLPTSPVDAASLPSA